MSKRKLIIISNDALVKEDAEYLFTKPAFKSIVENGSWVKTLKTVYPSVTYCCHASMITGCYPQKTGITNNEEEEFGNTKWLWERKHIKVKTLVDAFKEKGYTTANVFWPVLGNDKNIDYNIPEYWSQTGDEPLTEALKKMGTSQEVIDNIVKPNLYYIDGHQRTHPYADEFVFACTRDIIKKYQPALMLVHPAGIDGMRHYYGLFNDYVTEQLDYTYYWIEKIVRLLKENGTFENTDVILTSDHGQYDIRRWGHPNVLFHEKGYIVKDDNGNFIPLKAYVKPIGGSAQVYLTDKSKENYDEVYKFLLDAVNSGYYGFEKCFTREEFVKLGLDGNFDFVLEADGFTCFGGNVTGTYFTSYDTSDYRTGRGSHGQLPDKGPQPSMFCFGPDFKKGVLIERRNTLDMVATVSELFGLDMPDIDGKVIEEICKR
ncbi:MAG: ectonucleotide pyrophosphatase/phosphodiesterase [Clostridia bacterium]|nr:ectonucleotide pyrophosphatase/phosphodiesterase [Clostridia bacterium]